MKIKLLDGTGYEVVSINKKGNALEIQLDKSVLTAEGAEEAFREREKLNKIEVYEKIKKSATIVGYVVLEEVRLKAGVVTVVLTKEVDKNEQRITAAHAKAVEATTAAQAAAKAATEAQTAAVEAKETTEQVGTSVEQLIANVDYLAMEAGVEL